MLSDRTVAEFARQTPLQQRLVELAWPALSVESRLQVIDAIQAAATMWDTPDWLCDLALKDEHPIVRLWAARYGAFSVEREYAFPVPSGLRPSQADLDRYKRTVQDPCGLVKCCAETADRIQFDKLEHVEQPARLLFIRFRKMSELGSLVAFLERGIAGGVDDDELADCLLEFMRSPAVERDLADARNDRSLGGLDYLSWLEKLWSLTRKAGRRLTSFISFYAPLGYGHHSLAVDFLAKMPEEVLKNLPYRSVEPAVAELMKRMQDRPDAFPEGPVESLNRYLEHSWEYERPSKKEIEESRLRTMADRQSALFELVTKVADQLEGLHAEMGAIREATARKKGIFG